MMVLFMQRASKNILRFDIACLCNIYYYPTTLAKLTSNGQLDSVYGTPPSYQNAIDSTALQADGKLLVAGVYGNGFPNYMRLERHLTDGAFDTTFDGDGQATHVMDDFTSSAAAVISRIFIQADGKILLGGSSGGHGIIFRYNQDGTIDAQFGVAGVVRTAFGSAETILDLRTTSSGDIIAAGRSGTKTLIAYFKSNGEIQ